MTVPDLKLEQSFYVTGGTLRGDAACYVVRASDEELYDGLKRGEFCYVLTARQMGKSSLMVRAAARLREEGSGVAILDLTAIGQNLDPEQWYGGLINQMGPQLECEEELEDFWDEHLNLGPLQRWMQAVRQVVLARYPGPVVVFIDEIDSVRSLPFSTDEFFAGIREFYNYRSEDPELERLTFCLLGVASPADLIQDTRTTPFNIGRRVELRDFTESEALAAVKLWDANSGQFLRTLVRHQGDGQVWFDPDRKRMASFVRNRRPDFHAYRCDEDGTLQIAEVATGRQVRAFEVKGLCGISPDFRILITTPDRETIKLLDLATAQVVATLRVAEPFAVSPFAFSKDGKKMAFGNFFGHNREVPQVILWDLATRERLLELHGGQFDGLDNVTSLSFSPDGNRLVSAHGTDRGGVAKFWDLNTGRLSLMVEGAGYGTVMFSPDGKYFAGGGRDRTVRIWDATSGDEVAELKGHGNRVGLVSYSPDGKKLVSGDADGMVKVWDLEGGPVPVKLRIKEATSLDFSPDGSRLISTNRDGRSNSTVRLWDTATWQEIFAIKGDRIVFRSVRFSPDGKRIASSDQHQVKIWDVSTGDELMTLDGHLWEVEVIAYSPDGSRIASGSLDRTVKLWDTATGEELFTLEGYPGQVYSVTFSPDGTRMASGSADGMVKIWDVATGEEISTLEEKGGVEIFSLAYSPNGKRLASGGYGAVTLRNTDGYKVIRELEGHSASISSIDFSPDGQRLASADNDGTTKLWNAVTGEELITLGTQTGGFGLVAFSPDGGSLVTSDAESVLVWGVATEDEVLRRSRSDQ